MNNKIILKDFLTKLDPDQLISISDGSIVCEGYIKYISQNLDKYMDCNITGIDTVAIDNVPDWKPEHLITIYIFIETV